MKLKDITESSGGWSTPLGTTDANPRIADGVLGGLTLWRTSVINLVAECTEGKYFGSIRAP